MSDTYKILGQSSPNAASLTTLYSCPTNAETIVSTISVANRSSTATTFRVLFAIAGAGAADSQYIFYDHEILGNEKFSCTDGYTMGPTDVLKVYCASTTVSFSAFGVEKIDD